jgi:RimJ/RimL family protein N-acetyltransferase
MQHNFSMRCAGFALRPVTLNDAEFIFRLRTDPQVGRFIVNTSTTLRDQIAWLKRYFDRHGDYYFIIRHEASGHDHGTIAIYDVDDSRQTAEWGRWLLKPKSLGALPSVWMMYECAFSTLNLQSVYCCTQAANSKVVSFHDAFGAVRTKVILDDHFYGGTVINHCLDIAQWAMTKHRVQLLIERLSNSYQVARSMLEPDQAYRLISERS